ncbi:MAG: dTDP-4-dehydrorhamnose reductase [Deltaproteobacteria bacterium]|nr:dTDP-4-dehydrorhamnose reductase [Deltaproteobacteria bacterium]MBW2648681.1 dTDP-4-dehydrorhamnose reductase [Deltaproteobacteria bacterium]
MKILVLGHKGMLGTDLMTTLGGAHDVIGKDAGDFDIASVSDCRDVVKETGANVVINAAAYTNVDGCETDENRCFSVNADGVKNVALACRGTDIKLIHFSTDYVFDGTKSVPYVEEDACNPINAYGRSKLKGEEYLSEFSNNYILLRTSWLYGKNGRNFVGAIVEKAEKTGQLEVVDDQTGSPTYTVDLAAAVKVLIEGDYRGVFHVTNRGTCSWYQFALKILEYKGMENVRIVPIKSAKLGKGAPRPEYSVLSCRKFADATHKTMRFWQIALKDYMISA